MPERHVRSAELRQVWYLSLCGWTIRRLFPRQEVFAEGLSPPPSLSKRSCYIKVCSLACHSSDSRYKLAKLCYADVLQKTIRFNLVAIESVLNEIARADHHGSLARLSLCWFSQAKARDIYGPDAATTPPLLNLRKELCLGSHLE